jgi:hypothetical protein
MQIVNHQVRGILGPRPYVRHRDDLGERIDHHPELEHMRAIAQAGAELIELEMW